MSNPIVVKELVPCESYEYQDKSWTYEDLLDLFDDEDEIVHQLVLRCQEYERYFEKLKGYDVHSSECGCDSGYGCTCGGLKAVTGGCI
jgi:hypothetical protein